jgi:hypothetical protein
VNRLGSRGAALWEAHGVRLAGRPIAYDHPMTPDIDRETVVRRLAEVSHATWIRQKVRDQGADEADLPTEVTEHDLERAEDAVRELERLGLLGPSGPAQDSRAVRPSS